MAASTTPQVSPDVLSALSGLLTMKGGGLFGSPSGSAPVQSQGATAPNTQPPMADPQPYPQAPQAPPQAAPAPMSPPQGASAYGLAPDPAAGAPQIQQPSAQAPLYKPSFMETLMSHQPGMTWQQASDAARGRHYELINSQATMGYISQLPPQERLLALNDPSAFWAIQAQKANPAYQSVLSSLSPQGGSGAPGLPPGPPAGAPMIGDPGAAQPASGAPAGAPQPSAPLAGAPPGIAAGAQVDPARRALAMYAFATGHPDQAYTILQPRYEVAPNGAEIDRNSGSVVPGTNLSTSTYQNGFKVNPNDPNAPSFIPTLENGTMPDGKGGVVSIPGAVQAAQAAAQGKATGATLGGLQTIPNSDGTSTVGLGANVIPGVGGPPAGAPLVGGGTASGVGGPPGSAVAGATQAPGALAFAKGQADALNEQMTSLENGREGAIQGRNNALQVQGFALSHPMNPATPGYVAGANYLRMLPPSVLQAAHIDPAKIDDLATDAASFNRLTNQNILTLGKTLLPSRYTERELNLTKPIAGSLTTPNEAMLYSSAIQAAGNQRVQDQANFAENYQGPPTRQAFEQGWANSPQGQRSIFQDPQAWKNVTIHGKPAVVYSNDGQWGAFALGTPYAYKFKVQQ